MASGFVQLSDLKGKRVLVTSSSDTAPGEIERLRAVGAIPIHIALIEIHEPADGFAALDAAINDIEAYSWIVFTSKSAVRAFSSRLGGLELPPTIKFAAVGPATAEAAEKRGMPIQIMAKEHHAEGLFEAMSGFVKKGERILWPRARDARPLLKDNLSSIGVDVDDVEAYNSGMPKDVDERRLSQIIETSGVDAILFDSPSAVKNFVAIIGREESRRLASECLLIPIGPITAKTIEDEIGP